MMVLAPDSNALETQGQCVDFQHLCMFGQEGFQIARLDIRLA